MARNFAIYQNTNGVKYNIPNTLIIINRIKERKIQKVKSVLYRNKNNREIRITKI